MQVRAQQERKKRKELTPILDQILNGGPSTNLNVLKITQKLKDLSNPFFETSSLNRVIVFKYPNFHMELAENSSNYSDQGAKLSNERPVETAIYIPNDETMLQDGGYAIYIRQRDSEELLQRYLGVSAEPESESIKRDIQKLTIIDEIPSLDPFLLKTTFERHKIDIDEAYLNIAEGEEQKIKDAISERVRPIVSWALGTSASENSKQSQRFVDAIWNPSLPEASLFIEAFKIDRGEVDNVFGAWKGVSFYQQQFVRNRGAIAEIIKWFKSDLSVPVDIRMNKAYEEQLKMFKAHTRKRMMNVVSNINQIFKDYDLCYQKFIEDGDPIPFRSFLITSHYRYWILGYGCTSLIHCRNIFDRALAQGVRGQLTFDNMNEMLTNMDSTLSSQATTTPDL